MNDLFLSFQGSHMTTLPKALAELSALKYLRWEFSDLTDSGANQFFIDVSKNSQPIGDSLIELRLSNNKLESYPDLRPMKKLEKLTIDFNNIIKVSSILTLPSSLKELYLEENSISLIHYQFETLSQLNLLEMISNKINSIDRVTFPSSLATLNLANNTIETVTSVSFTNGISNLRILNLENNPIKSISATAFSQLTQLEEIHLQHTSLTRLPLALAALPKVHTVFLGEIMKCSQHNCYYTYIGKPKLVCTCEEAAALYSWYKQGAVRFQGKCVGDRDVQSFFIFNVPSCPQLTG